MDKLVFPLLCLLLLTLFSPSFADKTRYNCSSDPSSYAPNSTYEANLRVVLAFLSSTASGHLYHYSSAGSGEGDVVYGSFLCRGDTSQENCRNCVAIASTWITQSCPTSKVSIIYYEKCMLRYADRNFNFVEEKDPLMYTYSEDVIAEPDKFNQLLRTTIVQLLAGPKRKGLSYLHREAVFVSQMTLYLFAQCTPDLSATDCGDCLDFAGEKLENLVSARVGGRVLLPSCFMRYEIYPFYGTDWADDRYFGNNVAITLSISTIGLLLTIIGCCVFLTIKIEQRRKRDDQETPVKRQISELDSLQFHLATIKAATGEFSNENKLGEGGFGSVYKGTLPNGQQIAAKRLSRFSGQGVEEFKNEVESAAKLQHRNLVRLFGYSVESDETVVVYEYVPNGSLDHLLFEPEPRRILDWPTRLNIVLGVARGLLYLHEDSRLRVIHRDIKASNILLDDDMNPKISDFGMARIIGAGETQANTNRIVGTFGYLSPEYMSFGEFSVKSDVFSFGILVLELITGKKNNRFVTLECEDSLLGYVWTHWSNGTLIEVVDPALGSGYSTYEAFRCLHVGLLCVQDDADDRPTMDSVLRMLKNDSVCLPRPLQPMFFFPSAKFKRGPITDPSNGNSTTPSTAPSSSITDLSPP